jgi:hypothetical protein
VLTRSILRGRSYLLAGGFGVLMTAEPDVHQTGRPSKQRHSGSTSE